jgi:hypothetical protein
LVARGELEVASIGGDGRSVRDHWIGIEREPGIQPASNTTGCRKHTAELPKWLALERV